MSNICVFCGASDNVEPDFLQLAFDLGVKIAAFGHTLVYGGGASGLMGKIAQGVQKKDGNIISIYPKFMIQAGMVEPLKSDIKNTIFVDSMSQRKDLMIEKSDVFVIIPGGFGTLDELYEVMTLKILKQHEKPIIIHNYKGYWELLLQLNNHIRQRGFAKQHTDNIVKIVDDMDEIFNNL